LDLFEFLEALGEKEILDYLKNFDFKEKIPFSLHQRFLSLFNLYVSIGGMPEAVKTYLLTHDFNEVNNIYSSLFTSFKDDVYKYTSSAKVKYISFVL